jgi:PIN domain nuclease of toxin-antitoxin system
MANGQIHEVPLRIAHSLRLADLLSLHRDPFDRLLIATALEEDMTLLTNDADIHRYSLKLAW